MSVTPKISLKYFLDAINDYASTVENPTEQGKVKSCIEVFSGIHQDTENNEPMHLGFLVGEILTCLDEHYQDIINGGIAEMDEVKSKLESLSSSLDDLRSDANSLSERAGDIENEIDDAINDIGDIDI